MSESRLGRPSGRTVLSAIYVIAVGISLWFALRSDWDGIEHQLRELRFVDLALSMVAAAGFLIASLAAWVVVLRGMGATLSARAGAQIFLVSQVGKYLPGSVWPAVAQVEMGRSFGIRRATNLGSFFMTLLLSLTAGSAIGALAWALISPIRLVLVGPALALSAFAGVSTRRRWSTVHARIPGAIGSRLPEQPPSLRSIFSALGILAVGWILNGMHFWLLARGVGISGDHLLLRSVSGFAFAFVGGLLFLIAPAGAGVREAILISVFRGDATVAVVTAVVLVSRVIVTFVDIAAAGVGLALSASRGRTPRRGAFDSTPQ